jgi:putative MATE family efflux protein
MTTGANNAGAASPASGVLRPVLRLAVPVIFEQLLAMLVGFSDTLLTGWYLTLDHLAAVNLMVYLTWILTSMFVVVTIGATALVARSVGAADGDAARRVTNQAFLLGAVISAPVTVLGYVCGRGLIALLQLDGTPGALALQYWDILIPALPAMMFISVGSACLRGAGDTVAGFVIMGLVNLANIALSWSLMRGWGPMPELGWGGIAWGTSLSYQLGGLLMLCLLLRGRAGLRLRAAPPDVELLRRILRVGVPGGADVGAVLICQMWYLAIVNQLGALAAAAHGVAIRIEALAYLPGLAFQVAATTLAGQYLGAKDLRRAHHSVLTACLACLLVMLTAGAVFYFGAEQLANLFLGNEQAEVARQAAPLLRTIALGMPALALLTVFTGALRGAGDTRWALLFTLIGFLAVRIPLTYALTDWIAWGVEGAWYAMVADLYVRAALVTYRFRHGGWTRVAV